MRHGQGALGRPLMSRKVPFRMPGEEASPRRQGFALVSLPIGRGGFRPFKPQSGDWIVSVYVNREPAPAQGDSSRKILLAEGSMSVSFRGFGLVTGTVVAATVATTGVSFADVKKISTKFVNKLPVEVIVTFEGTGVLTGSWHAKPGESRPFMLIPENSFVSWKAIPAVLATSTFTTCNGTQKIGSGINGDTIVLNADHCDHVTPKAAPANTASGSGAGSGAGSSSGQKNGSVATNSSSGNAMMRVTVKNTGEIPVKVTVTFSVTYHGTTSPFDDGTGLIAPHGQGEVKKEWIPGSMLQPTVIGWKAYRTTGEECNSHNYPAAGPLEVSCNPKPN